MTEQSVQQDERTVVRGGRTVEQDERTVMRGERSEADPQGPEQDGSVTDLATTPSDGATEASAPAADLAKPPTGGATDVADVEEALRDVVDPELGINVVDLGLIYGVTIDQNNHAVIDMTLTSAACPLTDVIEDQAAAALDPILSGHTINWVWMPPWGPDKITEDGRDQLRALGFNV